MALIWKQIGAFLLVLPKTIVKYTFSWNMQIKVHFVKCTLQFVVFITKICVYREIFVSLHKISKTYKTMAHKRSINDTFLGVNFAEGKYTLFLINAHEVMGHDDSLPYNAFFELRNNGNNKIISGKVWNDGWGGDSNIELDNPKEQSELDAFAKYIEEHIYFTFNGYAYNMNLAMLFDNLAFLSIDAPKNNGHIFSESAIVDYLKKR